MGKIASDPLEMSLAVSVCLKKSLNTEASCCGVASVCASKFWLFPTIVTVSELPALGHGMRVVSTALSILGAAQAQCWLGWTDFTAGNFRTVC